MMKQQFGERPDPDQGSGAEGNENNFVDDGRSEATILLVPSAVPGMRSGYCLVGTKGLVDLDTKANQSLSSVLGIPVLMLEPRGGNGG